MRIRTVEISDDVADVLRRSEWNGRVLMLPPGQLDRAFYAKVDKVIRALGGRWDRGARGHAFPLDSSDQLKAALDAGSVVDQKKTLEQFFTPLDLARRMARALDIRCSEDVLEPSAGGGALVIAAMEMAACVHPIELDARLAGGLHRAIEGHFRGGPCPGTVRLVIQQDFLSIPALSLTPDKVIMNPPFSGNQDIAHVCHALGIVRPGGKLAAIMSPHFTFADDAPSREFRALIGYPEQRGNGPAGIVCQPSHSSIASVSVELLPAGTFKDAGTNISAVLIIIDKAA